MSADVRDPVTQREWQDAVDAAHFYRCVADCQMYGLITGADNINIQRCDWILKRGAELGIYPAKEIL
jgi:hypothetical protein